MIRKVILLVCFFHYCILGYATSFCSINYNVKDGLPSSQVYCAVQDSLGFMWFGTDRGISRFDGKEFENFTDISGVSENVFVWLRLDSKSRVWARNLSGEIVYFDGKQFIREKYFEPVSSYLQSGYQLEDFTIIGNQGIFLLYNPGKSVYEMLAISTSTGATKKLTHKTSANLFCVKVGDKYLTSLHSSNKTFENQIKQTPFFIEGKITLRTKVSEARISKNTQDLIVFDNDKVMRIHESGKFIDTLVDVDSYKNIYIYDFLQIGETKFIGTNRGLVIDENGLSEFASGLEEIQISDVFQDNHEGMWLCSTNSGLFYIENRLFRIVLIPSKVKDINFLGATILNQSVWFWNFKDNLVGINNGEIKSIYDVSSTVNGLSPLYNNVGVICNTDYYVENGKLYMNRKYDKLHGQLRILDSDVNNQLLCKSTNALNLMDKKNFTIIKSWAPVNSEKIESYNKDNKYLYIGTNFSLYKMKTNLSMVEKLNFHTRINDMVSNNGLLFLATTNQGILVLNNDIPVDTISTNQGLSSNSVNCISVGQVENKPVIFVGTNNGLNIISNYKPNEKFDISVVYNAVENQYINDITLSDSFVYILGTQGISYAKLNKNLIKKEGAESFLRARSFQVNGLELLQKNKASTYKLKNSQNDLLLVFDNSGFPSNKNDNYEYQLIRNDEDAGWEPLGSNSVNFHNLKYGNYDLVIRKKEEFVSMKPLIIHFDIQKRFTQTNFFIISSIALALFSLFLIILTIFRYKQKQLKLEFDSYDYRQMALRSQMNPHFIFNALNSIQYFFLTHDKESSNNYLTQFAQLFRRILDMSRKADVTLEEEIQMIDNYLLLEEMRFKDKFTYEIKIEDDSILKCKIPSLLIQPIVENAVVHGISALDSGGFIQLKVRKEMKEIIISIQDNGPGIDLDKNKNSQRKRVGMKTVESRIEVLNKLSKESRITFKTFRLNLTDQSGTKVEFHFPIRYD